MIKLTCITLLLFPWAVQAATVTATKGKMVSIDLEGDVVDVDDKFFLLDENNKKKALVTIKKANDSGAIAQVIKGKAEEGMRLLPAGKTGQQAKQSRRASVRGNKSQMGGLLSFNMNTLTTKPATTPPINASGNSFDLLGFFQIPVDDSFSARLLAGYQTLSVKAPGGIDANISYLGLGGIVKYSVYKSSTDYWLGAGLSFLVPISKSSNGLIDASKVSTNQTILFTAGADIGLSGKAFVPVSIQYALFPSTATVSTSQIQILAGYGISF